MQAAIWRRRDFRRFAYGNIVNNLGEGMYALALPLLAYETQHSLRVMALLAAVVPLALTIVGPLMGAVVDRFGPRSLVLPGLGMQAVTALLFNIALALGANDVALLFIAEFLVQTGAAAYRAGWMAGLPVMFSDDAPAARGALAAAYQATLIVGPAAATLLVGPVGIRGLLWINFVTFLAPLASWLVGARPEAAKRTSEVRHRWDLIGDLREGWRVLRASRNAFLLLVVLIPSCFAVGTGTLTLIVFHLRNDLQLSESGAGVGVALTNVGALLGATAAATRPPQHVRRVCLVGMAGLAACFLLLAATEMVAVTVLLLALLYLIDTGVAVAADMLLYRCVPSDAIGRSIGFFRLILGVPALLGPLAIAAVGGAFGAGPAFALLGVGLAACTILFLRVGRPEEPVAEATAETPSSKVVATLSP